MSYSEKIYPEIPSAPPTQQEHEGQTYRLKKIDDIEKFLRKEVAERDALSKRCKRRATAMTISDGSVIAAITALERLCCNTHHRYRSTCKYCSSHSWGCLGPRFSSHS